MMKKLLLPIVAGVVLSVATPSFATFWNHDKPDWNFDWPKSQDHNWDHDWDWDQDQDHDWPDWGGSGDWPGHGNWCRPKDNPVPEPATAGLSLMGLAALGAVTRRRRK